MTTAADRAAAEARVLSLLHARRLDEATTEVLRSYGPEIYALFASIHRDEAEARDTFSMFCEDLWRGLPGFEQRSSVRTWAYAIAWRASSRYRAKERGRREEPVTDGELLRLAEQIRTSTHSRLLRQRRSRVRELRELLPPEDQLLLVLRIERELDWSELVRVIRPDKPDEPDDLNDAAAARASARLRKRFQAVVARLRELVRADEDSLSP